MLSQKIGFFGGTFDPIHFGHISLAIEMLERHQLDAVWFCPASQSPFKLMSPPTSIEHRMEMVNLAIEEIPQFKHIDTESKREGPSYTIDTIRQLLKESIDSGIEIDLRLILSDKEIPGFFKWREVNELVSLAPPLIGSRRPAPPSLPPEADPEICKTIKAGWTPMPILEISGTNIRERFKFKRYCGHLVPRKVLDYIYENEIY